MVGTVPGNCTVLVSKTNFKVYDFVVFTFGRGRQMIEIS